MASRPPNTAIEGHVLQAQRVSGFYFPSRFSSYLEWRGRLASVLPRMDEATGSLEAVPKKHYIISVVASQYQYRPAALRSYGPPLPISDRVYAATSAATKLGNRSNSSAFISIK